MERLQKLLANAGLGSRRSCEELILQGRVTVDGKTVTKLGTKVDPFSQLIKCDGELIKAEKKVYYAFYKPKGVLCTNAKDPSSPRVIDYFAGHSLRLFPVGRLDRDSEGLIIVTNDGEFAQRLSHPSFLMPKTYLVMFRDHVSAEALEKVKTGVWLSIGKISPSHIKFISNSKKGSKVEVTIVEGKNREIRRIFAKVGFPVNSICRTHIGTLFLGNLKAGNYRPLTNDEINMLLQKTERQGKNNESKRQ